LIAWSWGAEFEAGVAGVLDCEGGFGGGGYGVCGADLVVERGGLGRVGEVGVVGVDLLTVMVLVWVMGVGVIVDVTRVTGCVKVAVAVT
jgi:hypothetical protein